MFYDSCSSLRGTGELPIHAADLKIFSVDIMKRCGHSNLRTMPMKRGETLALTFALVVVGGTAIAGRATGTEGSKQTTQSSTQEKASSVTRHVMGTVASVTPSELVLNHNWRGK